MRFAVATVALAAAANAQNYMNKYPLSNGFPNPSASAIAEIEKNAGGPLPNAALPSTLSDDATAAFTLIALNEIFEVAYFSSLLTNITQNKPGYVPGNAAEQKYLMRSIFQIRAQEEIHALAANAVLKAAGKPTVTGCQYTFPSTDLASGIHVANLFTDVVLGALAQVQGSLAMDGGAETALVPIIGAILAQEGEQVGYFRYFQNLVPSAAPLLTGTPAPFAYGALSMFLVPGSCNIYPNIPKLPSLTVVTTPQAMTMDLIYTVEGTVSAQDTVTYLSGGGRNPVTVPIKNISSKDGKTQFAASFPYDSGFANGLTLAAVTKGNGPFSSPSAVAAAAAYGPGLIEVD